MRGLSEDPCQLSSRVFRDPHINFAYGGSADIRGRQNAVYNFLSAPGFSVNVKTEAAVFKIHNGALTVNGSFLTEAHTVAHFASQRSATASFWASELDDNNFGWQTITGTCVGRPFKFGNRGHKTCYALKIDMAYSSATFEFGNWTVIVRGMPSCNGCLVAGPKHRLDVSFSARGDALTRDKPHGIIGQSYATPGLERHGKKDVYPWAGSYTTSAQAEGAIDGTASDYEVASAHATEFTFSRFTAAKGSPAEGTKAGVIVASSIDRVADPATEPQRRRLSEAPCPPPSAGGSTGEPAVSAPPPEPPLPPPPFYYSPAPPDVYNPSLAGWGKIDDYYCSGKSGRVGTYNGNRKGASCYCQPGISDSADNPDPILTAAACAALADESNSHAFTFDNRKMCEIFSCDGRKNIHNPNSGFPPCEGGSTRNCYDEDAFPLNCPDYCLRLHGFGVADAGWDLKDTSNTMYYAPWGPSPGQTCYMKTIFPARYGVVSNVGGRDPFAGWAADKTWEGDHVVQGDSVGRGPWPKLAPLGQGGCGDCDDCECGGVSTAQACKNSRADPNFQGACVYATPVGATCVPGTADFAPVGTLPMEADAWHDPGYPGCSQPGSACSVRAAKLADEAQRQYLWPHNLS